MRIDLAMQNRNTDPGMSSLQTANLTSRIQTLLAHRHHTLLLAVVPLSLWVIFQLGGETALLTAAVATPLVVSAWSLIPRPQQLPIISPKTAETAPGLTDLRAYLDRLCQDTNVLPDATLLLFQCDHKFVVATDHHAQVVTELFDRLRQKTRHEDLVAVLPNGTYAVVLNPAAALTLETLIQSALRLQRHCQLPMVIGGQSFKTTIEVGICRLKTLQKPGGHAAIVAAKSALQQAHDAGPGTVRLYAAHTEEIQTGRRLTLAQDLAVALETGQIVPWYQPQISTDTGEITGMEALARWEHPRLGVLSPGEFLGTVEAAGLNTRLTDIMLTAALADLTAWDARGFQIPKVSINFSEEDLLDPTLPQRIAWVLDDLDLTPDRLTIEVLETVIGTPNNDDVATTLGSLRKMGCGIDLDDFGTGSASITNIQRYSACRIKIDRSFVSQVDAEPAKRKMIAAMLTMAEQLQLEVVAEGVEGPAEHELLAQLGCHHVQGYAIARPMPARGLRAWLGNHRQDLSHPVLPVALQATRGA